MAGETNKVLEIAALRFSRDWTDPNDFKTVETSEVKVRADMQYLFNEIKNWLNETLIPAVQSAADGGGTGSLVKRVYINANGHLIVVKSDDSEVDLGAYAGGASGEYVTALKVNAEGHLIVTMSDGTEKDLGELGGIDIINNNVVTQNLYAENGDIANLTVDSLSTSRRVVRYLARDTSDDNYIRAEDQYLQFITGTTDGSSVQHTDRYGRNLYWKQDISGAPLNELGYPEIDGKQVLVTTEVTDWPVMVYAYTEICKMQWAFEDIPGDDSNNYIPTLIIGAGAENGTKRGFIYKLTNQMRIDYLKSDGTIVSVTFSDDGVKVEGAGDKTGLRNIITVKASAFNAGSTYGNVGDIVAVVED